DLVRQVEPALGLHHVAEHREDVPVLPPQPELHVVFEPLDVLFAQSMAPSTSNPDPRGASIRPPSSAGSFRPYRATYFAGSLMYRSIPLNDIRWIGEVRNSAMSARRQAVPSPLRWLKPYCGYRR